MKASLILALTFTVLHAAGQTLLHSNPETKDLDRFRFRVLTRKDNRLVIYKSVSFNSHTNTAPLLLHSAPGGAIIENDICIYDSLMNQQSEMHLPLPKEISGAEFIVYDDFFYIIYQYKHGYFLNCMAARVDFNGQLLGAPVCLDSTRNAGLDNQSQIYAVTSSEDKKWIMVYKLNGGPGTGTILNAILFDGQLHELHRSTHGIDLPGAEYLSEFQLDNQGNFLFVGLSHSLSRDNPEKAILFTLKPSSDSLSYGYFLSGTVFLDDVHVLIDNLRGRYILGSFFTSAPQGDVEGLFIQIRDANGRRPARTTFTLFSDSLRRAVHDRGNLRKVFNNYYLHGMRLLADGTFTLETQQLIRSPDPGYYNRWSYMIYHGVQHVGSSFLFNNTWEKDRYAPWNDWRLVDLPGLAYHAANFSSDAGLIAHFDPLGIVQWMDRIRIPQNDIHHDRLGYTSMVSDDRLYFIFNETIRNKQILSGQCIDAEGALNTDARFREDQALGGQNDDYTYYPRLAEQAGDELIIPCLKGRQVCLARLRL